MLFRSEYAYQARAKFPDRRIFLAGEIIHNPHVNNKLSEMGIEFLSASDTGFDYSQVRPEHVVILPAFGVTIGDFETLRTIGCVMVDTTCGSVLNVWKRVDAYARDGYTSLIHGKYYHEETRATASQVERYPGGSYLVVRNMEQALEVCAYIEGTGMSRDAFLEKYAKGASPHFDPDVHLTRVGVANQTTMLRSETEAIQNLLREAVARRDAGSTANFRYFDTICGATQDRQDALFQLLNESLDLLLVVGGYNSSNTTHLAEIGSTKVPTWFVSRADCLISADRIRTISHGEDKPAVQGHDEAAWSKNRRAEYLLLLPAAGVR